VCLRVGPEIAQAHSGPHPERLDVGPYFYKNDHDINRDRLGKWALYYLDRQI